MSVQSFVDMTTAEIARKTGIAVAQWSRYLNRKKTINENTLNQAAKRLGMSSDELLKAINIKRDILTNQSS